MNLPMAKIVEVLIDHQFLDGLKILHLSDLHINKKFKLSSINKLLSICADLEYDFVVITGDIIDCKVKDIKEKLQLLNKLSFLRPVYYISGNHDIFYGLEDLKKELSSFILMDNKSTSIDFKGNKINIVGISDRFAKFFNIKREEKKISAFLKSSTPTIFLAHQPKDYKLAVLNKTELFVCGHTHGGQIFPFHYLVRLIQPFLNGLFYKEQTAIYVSPGLGTWGINFRYKANSEITILKLISKSVK